MRENVFESSLLKMIYYDHPFVKQLLKFLYCPGCVNKTDIWSLMKPMGRG